VNKSEELAVANIIWQKLKGKDIPKNYTEEEIKDIIEKYWHRAMENEQ
jgi:hypothetical protein